MKKESQMSDAGQKAGAVQPEDAPVRIRVEPSVLSEGVTMKMMDDGLLLVRAPLSMPKELVIRAVEEKRGWIRSELVRLGLRPAAAPVWEPLTEKSLLERFEYLDVDVTTDSDWIIAPMPWDDVLFYVINCPKGTYTLKMMVGTGGCIVLAVPPSFSVEDVVAYIKTQTEVLRRGLEVRLKLRLVDRPGWRPAPFEVLARRPIEVRAAPGTGHNLAVWSARQSAPAVPTAVGSGPLPESGFIEAKVKGRKVLIPFRKHSRQVYVALRRLRNGKCVIHVPMVMTREQLRHYISEHEEKVAEYLKEKKVK